MLKICSSKWCKRCRCVLHDDVIEDIKNFQVEFVRSENKKVSDWRGLYPAGPHFASFGKNEKTLAIFRGFVKYTNTNFDSNFCESPNIWKIFSTSLSHCWYPLWPNWRLLTLWIPVGVCYLVLDQSNPRLIPTIFLSSKLKSGPEQGTTSRCKRTCIYVNI